MPIRPHAFLLLFCALIAWPLPALSQAAGDGMLTPVRLQLKWTHQFQGAGFYVALAKGYYREAGLDVRIIEGGPTVDAAAQVSDGAAEFGVGSAGLLVERVKGRPVVAMAVLMQHSPFVLLTRIDTGPPHVHALPGHRLMLETHAEELLAYLAVERVPVEMLTVVPHSGSVEALIKGDVDAITAYTTSEPYDLRAAGIPYQVFSPRAAGIDFYGDTIFTSERMVSEAPSVVEAFRKASLRGWRDALTDPAGAIDLIRRDYAPHLERARLAFEAEEMARLMMADMVEVGYMHAGRWRHIAEGFAAAGLMPRDTDLDGFLYAPDQKPDLTWFYVALAVLAGLTLAIGLVTARFRTLNGLLRAEVAERARLEAHFRTLASQDGLTGLPNRRAFLDQAQAELARARVTGLPLSLLMLDIDHFKAINDRFGHAAGDASLIAFCNACRATLREQDVMGRLGGEEFAVLLGDTEIGGALATAERLRAAVEERGADTVERHFLTVSVGVATLSGDENLDQLLIRADRALYTAKMEGRNRVVMA
ncbi:diguanylate cyclase [Niveispirillum sp. KHB5.9]|uniref:diguanylate cyclase n=1 Tax=Niveispirillum sp. KHB5.9 TaxID=3400269 RepID=UPI003A89E135